MDGIDLIAHAPRMQLEPVFLGIFGHNVIPIQAIDEIGFADYHQAPDLGLFETLC
jgi:hypothetical protein